MKRAWDKRQRSPLFADCSTATYRLVPSLSNARPGRSGERWSIFFLSLGKRDLGLEWGRVGGATIQTDWVRVPRRAFVVCLDTPTRLPLHTTTYYPVGRVRTTELNAGASSFATSLTGKDSTYLHTASAKPHAPVSCILEHKEILDNKLVYRSTLPCFLPGFLSRILFPRWVIFFYLTFSSSTHPTTLGFSPFSRSVHYRKSLITHSTNLFRTFCSLHRAHDVGRSCSPPTAHHPGANPTRITPSRSRQPPGQAPESQTYRQDPTRWRRRDFGRRGRCRCGLQEATRFREAAGCYHESQEVGYRGFG